MITKLCLLFAYFAKLVQLDIDNFRLKVLGKRRTTITDQSLWGLLRLYKYFNNSVKHPRDDAFWNDCMMAWADFTHGDAVEFCEQFYQGDIEVSLDLGDDGGSYISTSL